jgi:two-component system LytT family response regulator
MLNTIIVEDEKYSRETLKNLLEEFCPEVKVAGMAESVDQAIPLIRNTKPDLVFLDIELQTGTGFDILAQLQDMAFEVIFTTAFEQYAIKAIKFSSLDYLLKPIDLEELKSAIQRALVKKTKEVKQAQMDVLFSHFKAIEKSPRKICLATSDGLEFINASEILYCEANGSYTNFHLSGQRKIIVSKNLKEYENLLDPVQFMRVHNSYLINLHEVRKFVKSDGGFVVMNDKAELSISPKKRIEFLERMEALA